MAFPELVEGIARPFDKLRERHSTGSGNGLGSSFPAMVNTLKTRGTGFQPELE